MHEMLFKRISVTNVHMCIKRRAYIKSVCFHFNNSSGTKELFKVQEHKRNPFFVFHGGLLHTECGFIANLNPC